MSDQNPPQPSYRPGDVVNGWVLSEEGEWRPADYPSPAAPQTSVAKKRKKKWPWIVGAAAVVVLVVLGFVGVWIAQTMASEAEREASVSERNSSDPSENSFTEVEEPTPTPEPVDLTTFAEIDGATWESIAKDANAHVGEQIIAYAEVIQYDSATGANSVRAFVGAGQPGNSSELTTNTFLVGDDASVFAGAVLNDVLKVHAVVTGILEYETTAGGFEVVPELTVVAAEDVGFRDLTADATVGAPQWSGYGSMDLPITVTNTAPTAMDFSIEVVAESPDGSTQYDSGTAYIESLNPGQSGTSEAFFFDIPEDATYRIVSVERYEP